MTSGGKRKRRIRVAGRANVATAANAGQPARTTKVSKRQNVEIVQRGGTTRIVEHGGETDGEDGA